MKLRKFKLFFSTLSVLIIASCSNMGKENYLSNFVNPSIKHTKATLKANENFNIVFLGDSHTAGQFISQYFFARFKTLSNYRNYAPGWQPITNINGQRSSVYEIKNNNKVTFEGSFRNVFNNTKPLLGSFIATLNKGSVITYKNYDPKLRDSKEVLVAKLKVRCERDIQCDIAVNSAHHKSQDAIVLKDVGWQDIYLEIAGDFEITSTYGIEIGELVISSTSPYITNNVIGVNGVTAVKFGNQFIEHNWIKQLNELKPNLVILAFGSNDSFNTKFNKSEFTSSYNKVIKQISKNNPAATIVLVSTPEINIAGEKCTNSRRNTQEVRDAQYSIAKQNRLIFWDWVKMNGGACSREKNIADGISAKDGIHFTINGSKLIGRSLANDLYKVFK